MRGTFRLIRGELRKIFLRPGIFIMTGLLVLVMTVAPKLFTPSARTDITISGPSGETVDAKYTNFESIKESLLGEIDTSKSKMDFLISLGEDNPITDLNIKYKAVDDSFESYLQAVAIAANNNQNVFTSNTIVTFINNINIFREKLVDYTESTYTRIFISKDNYEGLKKELDEMLARVADYTSDFEFHNNAVTYINNIGYLGTNGSIKTYLSKAKNLSFSKTALQSYIDNYYTPVTQADGKLASIDNELKAWMLTLVDDQRSAPSNLEVFDEYAIRYIYTAQSCTALLNAGLNLDVTTGFTDVEISKYMGFEDFSRYQTKEIVVRNQYLLDNDKILTDYATPFVFNTNAGKDTSSLDYMYFLLEIMSFLIITYGVVLGAGMISSEQSGGTIKMLAVRPFKRNKIMFGKIFTTMFFVTVFILLTALVGFITGVIIYGNSAIQTVLVVFNASNAFAISPVALLFIYLLCLWIKVLIFVLIAFAISTVFRSYVGAVIVSVLIYFLTMIASFVSGGASWLKYIPFANMDLFKYFGGSFVLKYTENSFLSNLFVSPVFADTTILYSGIIVGSLLIILNTLIYVIFKNRDIN